MDLIAAEAGVARQTIYNQFDSKEVLFRAIFSQLADDAMMPLAVAARRGASVRAALLRLARAHVAGALTPARLGLHPLVVAEAQHFPELGRAIYGAGAARVVAQLALFLREQTRLGHLDVPDPEAAAEQFFSMVTGFQQFRALMGVDAPAAEIAAPRRGGCRHVPARFQGAGGEAAGGARAGGRLGLLNDECLAIARPHRGATRNRTETCPMHHGKV